MAASPHSFLSTHLQERGDVAPPRLLLVPPFVVLVTFCYNCGFLACFPFALIRVHSRLKIGVPSRVPGHTFVPFVLKIGSACSPACPPPCPPTCPPKPRRRKKPWRWRMASCQPLLKHGPAFETPPFALIRVHSRLETGVPSLQPGSRLCGLRFFVNFVLKLPRPRSPSRFESAPVPYWDAIRG
jgi:hypothetical protein